MRRTKPTWLLDVVLLLVLIVGGTFRLMGLRWDEGQYLHPDERFLAMVETSIQPVSSWQEYFDTANSPLNPHNRGHPLFVYGTLPIFLVRYVAEWLGKVGYGEIQAVGRPISALVDLGTVVLVYLVARRLYGRWVALLASAFLAFSVLPIQLSHFFKEDTFMTFFTFLTLYFGVRIFTTDQERDTHQDDHPATAELPGPPASGGQHLLRQLSAVFGSHSWNYVGFGLALGMALASKVNSAPVALMLPLAEAIRLSRFSRQERERALASSVIHLSLAALVGLFTFRVLQPYAFSGPGFWGLGLNPRWIANLRELRTLASAKSIYTFPPSLQWAERPIWFAWVNQVLWGFGLPLGLLAWGGFLWASWRMLRGEWRLHLFLWAWTAGYFGWQSLVFNPTMRYFLPSYPALAIFAGWAIVQGVQSTRGRRVLRGTVLALGGVVLLAALAWAYAFTRIYTRPVTRIAASRWIYRHVPGAITLQLTTEEGAFNHPLAYPYDTQITPDMPFSRTFISPVSSDLEGVYFPHVVDVSANPEPKTLEVTLASVEAPDRPLGTAQLVSDLLPQDDPRGEGVWLFFDPPLPLERDKSYLLQIRLESGAAAIQISGSSIANESSWDDGLPMRVDGYDGFGGIYQGGLTFELYWGDNAEKRERFKDILQRADYLMISSSRQWGSITRLPEKYPLTTAYYRHLLGCPSGRTLEWCYNVADVGSFQGELGFELVAVFQSNPNLGPLTINDQFAEEAFTVYDHPKVFIFRKSPNFDPQRVAALLDAVELGTAPAAGQPESPVEKFDLTLPPDRWAEQQAGGTWAELFPPQSWLNRAPWLAAIVWYLSVWGLGLIAYPLLRIAMNGLEDRGFPLSRIAGLLLLAYLVWLGGSFRIPVSRAMISLAVGVLLIVSAVLAFIQREALRREWRERRRYLLFIESLALALFLFDLFIRLGNPDLWHPYKGGEKPMDFSYLNAVLKSTSFPPYDPWYAGGYINYYYYGFVVVGMLVKWLGIQPSVAYNLIIPTLFSLIGLGAFSIGWNVIHRSTLNEQSGSTSLTVGQNLKQRLPYLVGVATTLGMVVLGNLGIIRMLVLGYQRLVAPGGMVGEGRLWQRLIWTVQGFFRVLSGTPLPYRMDEWYWNPSRVIPPQGDTEPITEFPFFTVLYADLHAHLIAIPIALLVLAWALSVIFSRGWRDSEGGSLWRTVFNAGFGLFFGGLAIGALYPTNLSDVYTYLPLGVIAVGYALWRYRVGKSLAGGRRTAWTVLGKQTVFTLLGVLVLVGLSICLYQPYAHWYAQAYSTVHLWKGPRTPLGSYLSQWGLFLFLVVTWMVWETREWMAATPLSALRKLARYKALIQGGFLLVLVGIVALQYYGVHFAWLVIPLILWTGLLLLRPGLSDSKRVVLFLSGTALALTLMVELVVVSGDIGRMNTVFKFYLQAWTMFAIAAAVAFGWLVAALPAWLPKWRQAWLMLVTALVVGAALFPVLGSLAKIKDRMAPEAPHTLDGAAFMQYATYFDLNGELDLSQDYRAIRWMQENVPGSPVIIEANSLNLYHWFSRFTIYTGLPGVVGWDWHQRQQRALDSPEEVTHRVTLVGQFYLATDINQALQILEQFDVRYIILGQLERASYPGPGLEKFPQYEGRYWRRVYQDAETEIYQVIRTNE